MAVSTSKNLGLAASLLTIFSLIYYFLTVLQAGYPLTNASPFSVTTALFFAPLGIVGFILFLVAMYTFSKDYQDNAIFNYVLYGFIAGIVIAGVVFAIVMVYVFSTLGGILLQPTSPNFGAQFLQNFLENFLPFFLIVPIISLIPAFFNMLAFRRLASKSEVRLFRTVGLLGVVAALIGVASWFLGVALFYAGAMPISSIFTLFIASSVVSLAAWILAAKAFHSIPVPTSRTNLAPPTETQTPSTGQSSSVQIAERQTR